ncbi:MAG: hypothetical protein AABZ57_07770 [Candidatus Margulisiibacteriota bacterium]|mgnify:CR=1 FL=1
MTPLKPEQEQSVATRLAFIETVSAFARKAQELGSVPLVFAFQRF